MRTRTLAATTAAIVGCAGLGAFAATGLGDDPPAGSTGPETRYRIVRPALERAPYPASSRLLAARDERAKAKRPAKPKVTNLITTNPVAVGADDEIVAELRCKRSQGIPLSGGAISPGAPARVAISVVSRFSPNPPFEASPQSYFVGVRNLDSINPAEFRATLVCGKGITE